MNLSREEKLNLIRSLNWDYNITPDNMLAVIENKLDKAGPFDKTFLFIRSLERLPWHSVIGLWGAETANELYTEEAAARLWPKSRRRTFDFAFAVLRKEPVSPARWGSQRCRELQNTFLSHRWYRT